MKRLVLLAALLLTGTAGADPVPVSCGVVRPCLSIWPPAPINLQQTGATEDSISLAWDEPDPFQVADSTPTSVTIAWTPAPDPMVDYYTVERPSGKILGTTTTLDFPVHVGANTTSFRACVFATNLLGEDGPRLCGTFTKSE